MWVSTQSLQFTMGLTMRINILISKGCYKQAQTKMPLEAVGSTCNQAEQQNMCCSADQHLQIWMLGLFSSRKQNCGLATINLIIANVFLKTE